MVVQVVTVDTIFPAAMLGPVAMLGLVEEPVVTLVLQMEVC